MQTYRLEITMDAEDELDFIVAVREMKVREFFEHLKLVSEDE